RIIEEKVVKAPVGDVLFGAIGLIIGLIIAFLLTVPLAEINFPVVSNILPIFITILLGYFGFQVGFKKRDELINLFSNTKGK
ncbi:PIN domain nuclease, partial [Staphylococcus sp. SIMBA_130]